MSSETALSNKKISEHIASLIESGDEILTRLETALGGIILAHNQGKKIHAFIDEQGASHGKVPYTPICDKMAGALMSKGKVDRVFVEAKRVAQNGDFASEVGTYSLAVLCRFHSVPFFVVAPRVALDRECKNGSEFSPAFEVTPEALVSAWILDRGIFTQSDVRGGALTLGVSDHSTVGK